ncbi:HEPN domain-containing protein [Luteolibacter sp. Populi]|uniref:HEPN domain-containing protein n=1 Tax=Luteolibacter sp. Populi TaxID=3230487 RepID=UPI003466012A
MPPSANYYALKNRITKLRIHLLPRPFDKTGLYTDQQYDSTRAFVSLAHAEIEAFLEEICISAARSSLDQWNQSRIANRVIFSLYAMCYSRWSELEDEITIDHKAPVKDKNIEKRLACAGDQYGVQIGKNHGLREKHLKVLLVPLGVRIEGDLDKSWVSAMSSLGGHRGRIVHMAGSANQPPDPKQIRDLLAKEILPGLRKLDLLLQSLITSVPMPEKKGIVTRFLELFDGILQRDR